MKKNLLITLIGIIFLSTTTIFAQGGRGLQNRKRFGHKRHHKMMRKGNRHHQRFYKELNLSDKQQTKIEAIRTKYVKKTIDLQADLNKLRIDKRTAMKKHNFTKAKEIAEKMSILKGQINKKKISEKEETWNQLTDKQKKKAEELRKNRPRRKERRRQRIDCKNDSSQNIK